MDMVRVGEKIVLFDDYLAQHIFTQGETVGILFTLREAGCEDIVLRGGRFPVL